MKLIDFIDKMRVYQSSPMTIEEWCKSALVAGKAINGLYNEFGLYGCETTNGVPSEKWLKYRYATGKLYDYIDANAESIISLTMEEVTELYRDVLKSACKMYSPQESKKATDVVYLVATEEVYDYEDFLPTFKAFRNKEDAEKCFNETIETFKREYKEWEDGDWNIDKREGFWCMYPDGDYTSTHVTVRLEEVEVK